MKLQKLNRLIIFLLVLLFGVGFVFSTHNMVQSFSGIQDDLYAWLKALIYDEQKSFLGLFSQVSCIALSFLSSFLLFLLLSSGLSVLFSGKQGTFKRVAGWQVYKYAYSLLPAGVVITIAAGLIVMSVFFFNVIMTVSGFSMGLAAFISTFTGLNIIFFLAFAIIFSVWQLAKLKFGSEIALEEPEIEYRKIVQKSQEIGIHVPLIALYLVFIIFFTVQLIKVNEAALLPLLFLNVITYAGIKFLKSSAYSKIHV